MKSENKDMYVVLSKQGSQIENHFSEIRIARALKVVLKLEKLAFCNIRVNFIFIHCTHDGKLWLRVDVSYPVTNLTKLIYYEVNLKVGFSRVST